MSNISKLSLDQFIDALYDFYNADQIKTSLNNSPWIPTTNSGLDFLLQGGLLIPFINENESKLVSNKGNSQTPISQSMLKSGNGLIILIKGPAGSGKSTLAAQMMLGLTNSENKTVPDERKCYRIKDLQSNKVSHSNNVPQLQTDNEYLSRVRFTAEMLNKYKGAFVYNCELSQEVYWQYIKRFKSNYSEEDLHNLIHFSTLYDFEQSQDENPVPYNFRDDDLWINDMLLSLTRKAEQYDSLYNDKNNHDKLDRVIVIDGLNSFPSKLRQNFDMQEIITKLRKAALFSIIVYEDEKYHHENLDFLADIIIHMDCYQDASINNYLFHHLCIEKSRYQDCIKGWHQYKILSDKIQVFPSIFSIVANHDSVPDYLDYAKHSSVQDEFFIYENKNEVRECSNSINMHNQGCSSCRFNKDRRRVREFIYQKLLDNDADNYDKCNRMLLTKLLDKDILRGNSIAILGPKHSFKFLLALDFLRSGSANDENGLMLTLQDKQPTLAEEKVHLCRWACGKEDCEYANSVCYKRIYNFKLKSKWITPAEVFYQLGEILRYHAQHNKAITRFALCDLIQMEERFPLLAQDTQFIPTLLTFLRYDWGITSVIVGSSNSKNGRLMANLAYNTIYTWHDVLVNDIKSTYHVFYNPRPPKDNKTNNFFILPRADLMEVPKDEEKYQHTWGKVCYNIEKLNEQPVTDFKHFPKMQDKIWSLNGLPDME